ncbi:MAG: PIG-L family deacetylase [Anaerolineae bacterium]|nr:PIG-L family deacetylase [Anaerolineae bacterium]
MVADHRQKLIVVGAHPDDPETACGGTMALAAQAGCQVVSAYLTRGEAGISGVTHEEAAAIRTREALAACQILPARAEFLDQIDGACEITPIGYAAVLTFMEREQPDLVLTHWPVDTHRDHRICSHLVYDAWLCMGRVFALYYFEVMSGIQTQNFAPTDYVDIGSVLARKHEACSVHASQHIAATYAEDHGKMEVFRGLECGCAYAEAYVRQMQSRHHPLFTESIAHLER